MGRHDDEPSAIDAREVALRFGLGEPVDLVGPVARGELGQVWRLATEQGDWTVKESFGQADPAGALADAGDQDAVRTAGVRIPTVCRTREGDVLVTSGRRQIRVYGWVDLDPPDRGVDPVAVGELVAAIHRVHHPHSGAVDGWYTDPVGAASWDDLIRRLRTARAGPQTGSPRCGTSSWRWSTSWRGQHGCRPVIVTCSPTTCGPRRADRCASSTGRTAVRRTRARSSPWCCSSSGAAPVIACARCTGRTALREDPPPSAGVATSRC